MFEIKHWMLCGGSGLLISAASITETASGFPPAGALGDRLHPHCGARHGSLL